MAIVLHRRFGVWILLSLVLTVWQCYYINWTQAFKILHSMHVVRADTSILPQQVESNEWSTNRSSVTDGTKEPKDSIELEHYELMAQYEQEKLTSLEQVAHKKIVFWNEAYGNKNYGVGIGKDVLKEAGCPVWQCETTDNRTNVEDADAVLFHLRSWDKNDLPQLRKPNQRYVFWSIESAGWRFVNTNLMTDFFNWTMTYRWDSDIVNSYGWFAPTNNINSSAPTLHPNIEELKQIWADNKTQINYAAGKTKIAAWFVSNCNLEQSNRRELVNQLKKYFDVDVYGDCGTLKCPRSDEENCRILAAKKYKFYLSLENSLCQDYITEKFYGMMHHTIIPIVVDAHGHHAKTAPTHSHINVARFENVKHLAKYLIKLSNNDTLYNRYFWWKPYFKVRNGKREFNFGICHLCAALHNQSLPQKVYNNMDAWWDKKSDCKSVKFIDE